MSRTKIKMTKEDIGVDIFAYAFMTILALLTLLPFMNVVSKALSAEWAVVSGNVGIIPVGFQLDSMKIVIASKEFLTAFGNSALVTFVGTLLTLLVTGMTAYPLSKRNMPGMKFILFMFVFTMFFNGGMIPTYLLMKNLHLLNKRSVLILPALINIYHMLIIKNYYESLPESLEESAKLDGASNFTILFKIIIPLSIPVYASITVFTSVMKWNDYFGPMLYINSPALKTLPLYLRDLIAEAEDVISRSNNLGDVSPEGVTSAAIIASTVPILLVYPFLQKYFIKGMLIGSVKG
ncbi:MAG: carbohydrate ABC transporter permease [Clostridiales bacterium]|nr:carbohydrate ABC transporter permease [Clostridiales bacterium]